MLLEIRAGAPREPAELTERLPQWPEQTHSSAYVKEVVGEQAKVTQTGVEGNSAGFPSHIEDTLNRAVLVHNEMLYDHLMEKFPNSRQTLKRGGFAENFVVNDPSLLPSEVCIGDRFRVGELICYVSGPRFPCPKVDAWHDAVGMTQYVKEHGFAGIFLRVVQEGVCRVGDTFELLERPHPSFTVQRVAEGLWGGDEIKDGSLEFLQALVDIEELMDCRYKDMARTRLERLKEANNSNSTSSMEEENIVEQESGCILS